MKRLPHEDWPWWLKILDGIALLVSAIILSPLAWLVMFVVAPPILCAAVGYALYQALKAVVRFFTWTCPCHQERIIVGIVDVDIHQVRVAGIRDYLFSDYRQNGFRLESDLYRQFPWSGVRDFSSPGKHRVRYCPSCRNGWNAFVRESITAFHWKQFRERYDRILPKYRQNVEEDVRKQIVLEEEVLLLPSMFSAHTAKMTDG
jgi:hypothetical protein